MLNVGQQQQQQVRAPDGTILWAGGSVIGQDFEVENSSATIPIVAGDLVQYDSTNSVIPRPELTAAGATPASDLPQSLVVKGIQTLAAANVINILGVAQQGIGLAKIGSVAGTGSLVCCKSVAGVMTVGAFVGASAATAGAAATVVVGSALNVYLGAVFKINQVASPGTGSTTFVGILIKGAGSAAVS